MRLLRERRRLVLSARSTRLLLGYQELSNIDRVLLQCSKTCVSIFSLPVSWQNARFSDIRSFVVTTFGSFTNTSQRCFTDLLITNTSEINYRSGVSINPPCTAAAIM